MKIGLVGGTAKQWSKTFDSQRTINLFPVMDEEGKEVAALYGTAGLQLYTTAGDGFIRASFNSTKGRAFVVSGAVLYEVLPDKTVVSRGTLDTGSSFCTMTENATQLCIADGRDLYILTYSTNAFSRVIDTDLPEVGTVTFQDQYFIVNKNNSAEIYYSTLGDGSSWAALDFVTAESSPDDLERVYSVYGQLWAFGAFTTEVFYNSGNADSPFVRVDGARMQTGLLAAYSVADADGQILWLGADKDGQGIVYAARGYSPTRISTTAIELLIKAAPNKQDIRGFTYQEDGHIFYILTGGGLETSLVLDLATGIWHERAYLETNGTLSCHRAATHMFAFGKHLVGDKANGKIYEMSQDFYDDAGDEIFRQRTFAHLSNENKRFVVRELQVDFEAGVGLTTGQGSNPVALLETSNDGAKTWSSQYTVGIGALGKYKARAVWRRLGQFDLFTARITITDPVKVAICGAYLS